MNNPLCGSSGFITLSKIVCDKMHVIDTSKRCSSFVEFVYNCKMFSVMNTVICFENVGYLK